MYDNLIPQFIGLVAVLVSSSVFQVNKRRTMLFLSMIGAVLWAVQFYLLGANTGAVMNLIGAIRCFVYFNVKPSKKTLWVLFAFLSADIVAGYVTWQGLTSLLAISGTMVTAIAFWPRKTKVIRRLNMIASPLWFSYNFIVGSYAGMTSESLNFASNLIGQYRFDFKSRQFTKSSSRA